MMAGSPPLALRLEAINWKGKCDLWDSLGARRFKKELWQQ